MKFILIVVLELLLVNVTLAEETQNKEDVLWLGKVAYFVNPVDGSRITSITSTDNITIGLRADGVVVWKKNKIGSNNE